MSYIPLKYTLMSSFLLLMIPILIAVSTFDYLNAKNDLENTHKMLKQQTENNIINAIKLANAGYSLLEKFIDDDLKDAFKIFIDAYLMSGSNPAKIDLFKLKKQLLNNKVDLYIINKQGIVEYTTYTKDLGLDFKQWSDVFTLLQNTFKKMEFTNGGFANEARTGILRKFAYMPTPDGKYILELGLVLDEFKQWTTELDIAKITNRLKTLNPTLHRIRIFSRHGYSLSDTNYKPNPVILETIKNVYKTKIPDEIVDKKRKYYTRYIFVNLKTNNYNLGADPSKVIELSYNTRFVDESLQKIASFHILLSIIAILLCIIFTFIISAWITKPIQSIVNSINIIAGGELEHQITVETNNELKLLKQSIVKMVNSIVAYTNKIKHLNISYSHFVPLEFLRLLEKESIIEVRLGDHVQKRMTILFVDIRAFTTLSETMSPHENFEFINCYLGHVSPVIRKYNGFIDKYIGDAVMALFPCSPDDAIQAAIEIHQQLSLFNQLRQNKNLLPVKIGIGLHIGDLMLGTIGEEKRMEGTVISDAVNLASRLEGLTKMYGTSAIVSEEILNDLTEAEKYHFRFLGKVRVKGKYSSVNIFELIDAEMGDYKNNKIKSKLLFNQAIKTYYQKQFPIALQQFTAILELLPQDKATNFYIKRCQQYIRHGIADNWDGVEVLIQK